ncbi:hypothetical protein N7541_002254 [Penicillium brevicompactum]|uniref:Phosphoglycerate mutase-like protein n=1 Tax=Penicillium brevicompactum TaxID=5074 RepID=A0A9W9RKV5_PENBR|nr:hypothetical protein N7541_002254 [Penicillium brevicompactum]
MQLLLVRHAESVDNAKKLWAGVTDSGLTNHGMAQVQRLAEHIASDEVCKASKITHVFSSDLQRARITAEGICAALSSNVGEKVLKPTLAANLRERDFGSLEGVRSMKDHDLTQPELRTCEDPSRTWKDCESDTSMRARVEDFFNEHLRTILGLESDDYDDDQVVIIVAHGLILRVLWYYLFGLFLPENVAFDIHDYTAWPEDTFRPSWSNTGFLNLRIVPSGSELEGLPQIVLRDWRMKVQASNYTDHLNGLRRTRGGIGSAAHDKKQKHIKDFFR